ncbi:MAG: VanZ family protein [Caldilineaceae bacterium]|nr:VanZ family protein [Caldilineaceae bacterium]
MRLRWLPALSWMALIFYLSHQPKADLAAAQPSAFFSAADVTWNRFWAIFFLIDWDTVAGKGAHIIVYAVLAYLLWYARPGRRFVFTVAMLFAISDEFHQLFVAGRTARPLDIGFDMCGVLIMTLWLRYRMERSS